MAKKSSKARKVDRLLCAVEQSYKSLSRMREWDMKLKRIFMGQHFHDGAQPMALNLINRSIVALIANLASDSPTAEIDAETDPALEGAGRVMSRIISQDLRAMDYRRKAQIVLFNGLSGAGPVKIGRGPSGGYEAEGRYLDRGRIYIDPISPHAWVVDSDAGSRDDRLYEGHGYRQRLRYLRDNRLIDEETATRFASTPNGRDEQRQGNVLKSSDQDSRDVVRFVNLVDLWLAPGVMGREAMYVTVPGDLSTGDFGDPIVMREWEDADGPPDGPYEVESFYPTPDNVLDTPPGPFWMRLAAMTNAMIENSIEGDLQLKNVGIIDDSMQDDQANALLNSKNGQFIRSPAALVNKLTVGGSAPEVPQKIGMYRQLFGDQAFSSDQLAGKMEAGRSDSPTATEATITNERQDALTGFMEEQHYTHQDRVVRKYFWLKRRDPMLREEITETIAGRTVRIQLDAAYFERIGDVDMEFSVERGSMRRTTTQQRAQKALQAASVVIPLAANLAQDPNFDAMAFSTSMLKQMVDEEEVKTWWRDPSVGMNRSQPPAAQQQTIPMPPGGAFGQPAGVPQGGVMTGAPGVPVPAMA